MHIINQADRNRGVESVSVYNLLNWQEVRSVCVCHAGFLLRRKTSFVIQHLPTSWTSTIYGNGIELVQQRMIFLLKTCTKYSVVANPRLDMKLTEILISLIFHDIIKAWFEIFLIYISNYHIGSWNTRYNINLIISSDIGAQIADSRYRKLILTITQ